MKGGIDHFNTIIAIIILYLLIGGTIGATPLILGNYLKITLGCKLCGQDEIIERRVTLKENRTKSFFLMSHQVRVALLCQKQTNKTDLYRRRLDCDTAGLFDQSHVLGYFRSILALSARISAPWRLYSST
jgi:hypothetical protein